jgi:channel protein (hemolysin III family)
MNVWTHALGALFFAFLMFYTLNSLSPHGIDRLSASFPSLSHEIELVQNYQEQFKQYVSSVRSHVPSMDEISNSLKGQASKMHQYYEMGEHALNNMQAQFLLYVHRIDAVVEDMQKAVGRTCPSCSLSRVQDMHRSLAYNVKKVSEILEVAKDDFVELAKEKVNELSKYVEMIDNKVLDFVLPEHVTAKDRLTYLPRTPIAWMIFSAICCLSFSAIFHLFYCHSAKVAAQFQKLDYAGICLLISGTASASIYYLFYCDPYRRNLYASIVFVLPLVAFFLTTAQSLMHPKYYPFRAGVFVFIGISVAFPLIQFYVETGYWGVFHWLLVSGGVSYIVGAGFYATRVPERLWPGKFDIWFHSHSLFHIFVVAAAFQHYLSLRVMYEWRMVNPCPAH